jgi:hypothetical protein
MNGPDDLREYGCAAIRLVIPIDRRDNRVAKMQGLYGLNHARGLSAVESIGSSPLNIAKAAGTGACFAKNEEGGRSPAPTLPKIRTHGFLANRMQISPAHQKP